MGECESLSTINRRLAAELREIQLRVAQLSTVVADLEAADEAALLRYSRRTCLLASWLVGTWIFWSRCET